MLPDFHPKMWLPNWLKPVEEQLRVEFPCTSTKMTCRLLYMLLLCTKIWAKKTCANLVLPLHIKDPFFFLEIERWHTFHCTSSACLKKDHTQQCWTTLNAFDAHWQQHVYTVGVGGGTRQTAHSQKWQEPSSETPSLSENDSSSEMTSELGSPHRLEWWGPWWQAGGLFVAMINSDKHSFIFHHWL